MLTMINDMIKTMTTKYAYMCEDSGKLIINLTDDFKKNVNVIKLYQNINDVSEEYDYDNIQFDDDNDSGISFYDYDGNCETGDYIGYNNCSEALNNPPAAKMQFIFNDDADDDMMIINMLESIGLVYYVD